MHFTINKYIICIIIYNMYDYIIGIIYIYNVYNMYNIDIHIKHVLDLQHVSTGVFTSCRRTGDRPKA